MSYTKEKLHKLYLEEKEIQRQQFIQMQVENITLQVLKYNLSGKTIFETSFVNNFPGNTDTIKKLLENIFIDSEIDVTEYCDNNKLNKINITNIKLSWTTDN